MAMPRSLGVLSLTRAPPMRRSPEVMSSRPAMSRRRVDLPQPEGPTKTTKSLSAMSRLTPWIVSIRPNAFRTSLSTTLAMALPLDGAGGEARHDLSLEDEDENDERQRDDHGCRHDVAPGQFVLARAGDESDGDRHR